MFRIVAMFGGTIRGMADPQRPDGTLSRTEMYVLGAVVLSIVVVAVLIVQQRLTPLESDGRALTTLGYVVITASALVLYITVVCTIELLAHWRRSGPHGAGQVPRAGTGR